MSELLNVYCFADLLGTANYAEIGIDWWSVVQCFKIVTESPCSGAIYHDGIDEIVDLLGI